MTRREMQLTWPEKYRPASLDELIVPKRLKLQLGGLMSGKDIPHIMMIGPPGIGKTCSAALLLQGRKQLFRHTQDFPNLSAEKQLELLKNTYIHLDFSGLQRVLFVDEADSLKKAIVPAVRMILELPFRDAAFIFAANELGPLKGGLQSRCVFLDYRFSNRDHDEMLPLMISRCREILRREDIEHPLFDVKKVVESAFPDMRAVLNALHLEVMTTDAKVTTAA